MPLYKSVRKKWIQGTWEYLKKKELESQQSLTFLFWRQAEVCVRLTLSGATGFVCRKDHFWGNWLVSLRALAPWMLLWMSSYDNLWLFWKFQLQSLFLFSQFVFFSNWISKLTRVKQFSLSIILFLLRHLRSFELEKNLINKNTNKVGNRTFYLLWQNGPKSSQIFMSAQCRKVTF